VRAHPEWEGAVLLVGADELADFPEWKQPNELLRLVWLGVATRPGNPRRRLDAALGRLDSPGRVRFFDLEPIPIASRELRERLDRGEDAHGSIPPAVWAVIAREGLYGLPPSYTPSA
jgi:nicotinic acid mononucleotide adenylyltransferase